MTWLSEAQEQLAARLAAEQQAAQQARQAFRTAGLEAVRQVLKREDGTTLTLAEAGLTNQSVKHLDLPAKFLVVSDGSVNLGAQQREDTWVVRIVEGSGANWTAKRDAAGEPVRVRVLADIAAALAV